MWTEWMCFLSVEACVRVMTRPQHTKPEVAEVSVTRRLSSLFLVKSFFRMSFYEWTHIQTFL